MTPCGTSRYRKIYNENRKKDARRIRGYNSNRRSMGLYQRRNSGGGNTGYGWSKPKPRARRTVNNCAWLKRLANSPGSIFMPIQSALGPAPFGIPQSKWNGMNRSRRLSEYGRVCGFNKREWAKLRSANYKPRRKKKARGCGRWVTEWISARASRTKWVPGPCAKRTRAAKRARPAAKKVKMCDRVQVTERGGKRHIKVTEVPCK